MSSETEDLSPTHHASYGVTALVAMAVTVAIFIPLYGIAWPPLADLPQQILVNKLLWEKLTGVSHLDLEISWYLGYRLISFIIVGAIGLLDILGISLKNLPVLLCFVFVGIHGLVVSSSIAMAAGNKRPSTNVLAACLVLPACAAIYCAAWFIGFVSFTLGVTLLVPAIFLTESYLTSGRRDIGLWLLIFVILIYVAHPFATFFWVLWCLTRALAAAATGGLLSELRRFLILALLFLPVLVYHFLAATGGSTASNWPILTNSPLVEWQEWYDHRLWDMLTGAFLATDETTGTRFFGVGAVVLVLFALTAALARGRKQGLHRWMLAAVAFFFAASVINEKALPLPVGHWLAYPYRFSSTAYVVVLSVTAFVLLRLFAASRGRMMRGVIVVSSIFAALISFDHLLLIRQAYQRFDLPARDYMSDVFSHRRPSDANLPRARWYIDLKFLPHYFCLLQSDCDRPGTLFRTLGGDVYPLRLRSTTRTPSANGAPIDAATDPVNAFVGSEGYASGQFSRPRGISVDEQGNFYVADLDNGRVQKFDPNGVFLLAFGRMGDGKGEFREPVGVATARDGHVYVVDRGTNRLYRFSSDGAFENEWLGPADKNLIGPADIDVGADGKVYIVDQGRGRIVVFDPAANAFSSWGKPGNGPAEFVEPSGISVNADRVFVADNGNSRVQELDLSGDLIRAIPVPEFQKYPWHYPDIAYDEIGKKLYISCGIDKEIFVYDGSGNRLATYRPTGLDELDNPSSLAIQRTNDFRRLLVLETGDNTRVTPIDLR